jgi:hypothetical protein
LEAGSILAHTRFNEHIGRTETKIVHIHSGAFNLSAPP